MSGNEHCFLRRQWYKEVMPDPIYRRFSEEMKRKRKHKGITQAAIAKELKITKAAVSKIESGRGHVLFHNALGISKLLGFEIESLCDLREMPEA
jgi:transcriptional regulator with XRE-family HTH domain